MSLIRSTGRIAPSATAVTFASEALVIGSTRHSPFLIAAPGYIHINIPRKKHGRRHCQDELNEWMRLNNCAENVLFLVFPAATSAEQWSSCSSLDARRKLDSSVPQNLIMNTVRRCLACCIVHSTSGFSRIVEPMMPLPLHLSVDNDNINRCTTTPPPFSIATSPLSPKSFAGQVESALLSRFRQSTIERVLTSWRYLGECIILCNGSLIPLHNRHLVHTKYLCNLCQVRSGIWACQLRGR